MLLFSGRRIIAGAYFDHLDVLDANAFLLFQVYDYMLTFKDEVRLVWPSRWSIGKVLFFLTRYPPFIDMTLVLVRKLTVHTFSYSISHN
jgi:hypothetical protein